MCPMDLDQDTCACDVASGNHAYITTNAANMRQYTKRNVGEADDPSHTWWHIWRGTRFPKTLRSVNDEGSSTRPTLSPILWGQSRKRSGGNCHVCVGIFDDDVMFISRSEFVDERRFNRPFQIVDVGHITINDTFSRTMCSYFYRNYHLSGITCVCCRWEWASP